MLMLTNPRWGSRGTLIGGRVAFHGEFSELEDTIAMALSLFSDRIADAEDDHTVADLTDWVVRELSGG